MALAGTRVIILTAEEAELLLAYLTDETVMHFGLKTTAMQNAGLWPLIETLQAFVTSADGNNSASS